jgi:hypothetical protein
MGNACRGRTGTALLPLHGGEERVGARLAQRHLLEPSEPHPQWTPEADEREDR